MPLPTPLLPHSASLSTCIAVGSALGLCFALGATSLTFLFAPAFFDTPDNPPTLPQFPWAMILYALAHVAITTGLPALSTRFRTARAALVLLASGIAAPCFVVFTIAFILVSLT